MPNRIFSLAVILFWVVSMSWLLRNDVIPAWTAQDVPAFTPGEWLSEKVVTSQARIENKHGHRVGTVWTEYTRRGDGLTRFDTIWLEKVPFLPPIRIDADSDFTANGVLDQFNLRVAGAGKMIELTGERYSGQLAFQLQVGTQRQLFKLDVSAAGMIADAFRPFPNLPHLDVGQSWRMQVVNPIAVLTGAGQKMIPMLVRVTGKEKLFVDEKIVECFVVQSGRAKAWVDPFGVVLRQEIDMPNGKFSIINEPFDDGKRQYIRSLKFDGDQP